MSDNISDAELVRTENLDIKNEIESLDVGSQSEIFKCSDEIMESRAGNSDDAFLWAILLIASSLAVETLDVSERKTH